MATTYHKNEGSNRTIIRNDGRISGYIDKQSNGNYIIRGSHNEIKGKYDSSSKTYNKNNK